MIYRQIQQSFICFVPEGRATWVSFPPSHRVSIARLKVAQSSLEAPQARQELARKQAAAVNARKAPPVGAGGLEKRGRRTKARVRKVADDVGTPDRRRRRIVMVTLPD